MTAPAKTRSMLDRARKHLAAERDRVNHAHVVAKPVTAAQAEDEQAIIEALSVRHIVMYGPDPVTYTVGEAEARGWAAGEVPESRLPGARLTWTDTGKLMIHHLGHIRFTGWRVQAIHTPDHLPA